MKAGIETNFWIESDGKLARNDGFALRTLKELTILIKQHQHVLLEAWNDYFS